MVPTSHRSVDCPPGTVLTCVVPDWPPTAQRSVDRSTGLTKPGLAVLFSLS